MDNGLRHATFEGSLLRFVAVGSGSLHTAEPRLMILGVQDVDTRERALSFRWFIR
jgi:hypothetical protein